ATEGQIFQLPLQLPHVETVRQRRKQIEGVARGFVAGLLVALSSEVAKGLSLVSELDQHHPYVLHHSQQHLAQRIELRNAIGRSAPARYLTAQTLNLHHSGDAIDQ